MQGKIEQMQEILCRNKTTEASGHESEEASYFQLTSGDGY